MSSYFIVAAVSYLLGSIPFGYLLLRIFKGEDVRSSGSGNIGATNVARKSRALGVATLLLDVAKGVAAVLIARTWLDPGRSDLLLTVAALFVVLGHMFPVWLKFRGGKGVAASLGGFLLLTPKSTLCMIVLFLIMTTASRYVSLGSVVAAAAFPMLAWSFHEYRQGEQLLLIAIVSALVLWKHRENMARLAAGTEAKFGKPDESAANTIGAARP